MSPSTSTTEEAVLLVNTHARTGLASFQAASGHLTDLGVDLTTSKACDGFEEMLREARRTVKEKKPLLIAGGGDGTLNALAGIVLGSETALGVLPLGTGNAFARDLGIPFDIHAACKALVTGQRVRVDVGRANDRYFLNVATVGLTTAIARTLNESMKRKFGRVAYVYAVLHAFNHIKPFEVTLETENGRIEFESLQVVIGNGHYHAGPFPIAPDARIDSGKLSLYALERASRASLLKMAVRMPTGRQVALPEVHSENTCGGRLTTAPLKGSILDGEIGPQTPLAFSIEPHALLVVAPRSFEG